MFDLFPKALIWVLFFVPIPEVLSVLYYYQHRKKKREKFKAVFSNSVCKFVDYSNSRNIRVVSLIYSSTALMESLTERKNSSQASSVEEPAKTLPQYIAAISVTLFVLVGGTVLGWTSPTLPNLRAENSSLPITAEEESWIGSLMPLGAIIGPFPGGISADIIGRKKSMLTVAVLVLTSWVILAVAQSVVYLYIGRLLAGFALGWGMTVQPMYLGEIATPNVRGALGVIGQIQICLGFLYVYSIGPFVSYLWLCVLCALLAVVFFMTFIFMPESPYYLVLKNDMKAATKALTRLRGQTASGVKKELSILQIEVEQTLQNKGTWKDTFMHYGNRRAVMIIVWLMALQQFCGINAVLFYSQSIFDKAESGLSPSSCTIVVGVVMTVASLGIPYLVEKMGRRPLIIFSSFVMGLALAVMGLYFFLDFIQTDVTKLSWMPLSAIVAFISAYSVGVGPIPWLLIGEVFAPNIRANGAAFSSSSSWVMAFVVTKLFQPMEGIIGSHGAFWFFGIVSFAGSILSFVFLPETKGKSLQEIQVMLNKK